MDRAHIFLALIHIKSSNFFAKLNEFGFNMNNLLKFNSKYFL